MLFKSKLFWISVILVFWAVAFIAVKYYYDKQYSEPIVIYNSIKSEPRKKQHLSEVATRKTHYNSEEKTATPNPVEEMDATDTEATNLSENTFTTTHDEFNHRNTAIGQTESSESEAKTDTTTETSSTYNAQHVADLRTRISNVLQERIDLNGLIYELIDFGPQHEEPFALRQELQKEAKELETTILDLINEYASYTRDHSPFETGGEFADLLKQNGIVIETATLTLEEAENLR